MASTITVNMYSYHYLMSTRQKGEGFERGGRTASEQLFMCKWIVQWKNKMYVNLTLECSGRYLVPI